jgi:hypothetical protein
MNVNFFMRLRDAGEVRYADWVILLWFMACITVLANKRRTQWESHIHCKMKPRQHCPAAYEY